MTQPADPPTADQAPTLTLLPGGLQCPVAPGQSLLEAALAAGIQLARSCRNGTCRACMCRLLEGQVRYRVDWPGLSPDEKDEGWTLPCVAMPEGDVSLDAPAAHRQPEA
jgi:ferredoxin